MEPRLDTPPAVRIQPYDFRQPRLFAQDQMRLLNHVHETFARDFAVYLSTLLRTIVDLRVASVEQGRYGEYVRASESPTSLFVVAAPTTGHRMLAEFDPRLVIFIVEKLFGSVGLQLGPRRELSAIEQGIIGKVIQRALDELSGAWGAVAEVPLAPEAFESNAEFVQIVASAASVFVVTFETTIYEQQTTLSLCYPYLLLERLLGRTGQKQWAEREKVDVPPEVRHRYRQRLREVTVELAAELGRTSLPLRAVRDLEVGDVLPLNRRLHEPIPVSVDGKESFHAAAGKAGKWRALRILDVIEPPDDDDSSD